jgi:GNAT superfamily N-acetyltransferase
MQLRSIGYRTDLIFPAFEGEILDRETYRVIRTPSNPTFYWGNFLLFAGPPQPGDFQRWRELFALEIGIPPLVRHQTFGWDTTTGEQGAIQPFLEDGFRRIHSVVLTARQVHLPPHPATEVTVRPLRTEAEWAEALANQVRCRGPEYGEAGYRVFKQRQMARYQAMVRAGLGEWFGTFVGEQLVADLGIFRDREVGRFQNVETHPDFRRRGIAGALVYQSARYALTQFGLETLVIVADYDGLPARLYQSVGFQPVEVQVGLEKGQNDDDNS